MNQNRLLIVLLTIVFLAASSAMGYRALAQSPGGFEVPWYTIDGGGGRSQGVRFTVTGTIGQPDAGYSTDGTFALQGGFWARLGAFVSQELHLPVILKE